MPQTPLKTDPPHPASVRGAERVRAVIEVEIEKRGAPPVHAWATDVSETGLFLQTTFALALNESVSLRFVIGGAQIIIASAVVNRVRPFEPINVTGEMPGAAVVFETVSALDKARLRRFVRDQLPGSASLDDTLPPALLAQDDDVREATLPLHLAAEKMRQERVENTAALGDDVTPKSPQRFEEIVTSLPPLDSDIGPAVTTWSVRPQAAPSADMPNWADRIEQSEAHPAAHHPSHLSSLRPLSLPPFDAMPSTAPETPSANATRAASEDESTEDIFASIERELSVDTVRPHAPATAEIVLPMVEPADPTWSRTTDSLLKDMGLNDSRLEEVGSDAETFDDDHVDFSSAPSWQYKFVARATPLPTESGLPAEFDARHVPTDLPDERLRTETLPGGPVDEHLGFESMPPHAEGADATAREIPSQKPRRADVDLDATAKIIRRNAPANDDSDGLMARDQPEGASVSGLWYAGADDIAERLADGRSLPPGVVFDDGDVDYVGSMLTSALDDETPTDDNEFTHSLRGRPSLADGSVPPQPRNHMFESDLPTMPPPDALNLSLGEVTPSILGDVSLSDSEVAFADRLGTDLDDDTFLTHSARLRRADALVADIFGDDSSSHSLHASSEGDVDDSEAFSLGELGSNEFSLPPDLDRSLDADQANIFGPLSTHEVTMRVRRKAALPWRRAALGAIVIGATGLGVGLALMDDTPAAAPTAVHAAAAPAKVASAPQSVAEIEGALAAKAPTAAPSSPKEVPAVVVASAPQDAAKEPAKTETHTSAVAPKPTAVDVDAAPKAAPKATAPLISKGSVIVPVEGGRVLKKFALENPTRLVVDIEGGHFFGHNMDVHAEGVARIRYGHPTPEVARFVVELEADQRAHALAVKHDDGSLTVGWKTR